MFGRETKKKGEIGGGGGGKKKKEKNYVKTGPTFAVATANTETKETKKQKSVHRNKQL